MKRFLFSAFLIIQVTISYGQDRDLIRTVDSLYIDGQTEKAMSLLQHAVKNGSQSPYIFHRMGMIQLETYTQNSGLDFLLRARELSSDDSLNTALQLYIAQAKYSSLDYQGALKELKTLYDLEQYRIPALTLAMNIYSDSRQVEKAVDISKQIISSEPTFMPAIANLGYLYLDINKLDSAIYYFDKANEIEPNHPIIINNLGNVYYKKGDFEKALSLIEKSISMLNTNAYAYRNRAYVLAAINRIDEACKDIEKAIELGYLEMYGNDIVELQEEICR